MTSKTRKSSRKLNQERIGNLQTAISRTYGHWEWRGLCEDDPRGQGHKKNRNNREHYGK